MPRNNSLCTQVVDGWSVGILHHMFYMLLACVSPAQGIVVLPFFKERLQQLKMMYSDYVKQTLPVLTFREDLRQCHPFLHQRRVHYHKAGSYKWSVRTYFGANVPAYYGYVHIHFLDACMYEHMLVML